MRCGCRSRSAAWSRCSRPTPMPSSAPTFPSAGGAVHFLVKSFGDGVLAGGLNLFMWAGYIISLALYAVGVRQLRGDVLHDDALAAAREVARDRRGAAADGRERVRRASSWAGRKRSSSPSRSRSWCCSPASGLWFIKPANLSPALWPEAAVDPVRRRRAVHRLRRLRPGDQRRAATCAIPRRMLPRALYTSVILVIIIYLAVAVTVTGNLTERTDRGAATTRWPKPPSRSWASSAFG